MRNKYSTFNQKRYEWFANTLEECGTFLINADDDIIKGRIFEDFDIDVRCHLSDSELQFFMDSCMIYEDIRKKCVQLRNKAVEVFENNELRSVNAVRTSKAWREILELSDEIRSMLYY